MSGKTPWAITSSTLGVIRRGTLGKFQDWNSEEIFLWRNSKWAPAGIPDDAIQGIISKTSGKPKNGSPEASDRSERCWSNPWEISSCEIPCEI